MSLLEGGEFRLFGGEASLWYLSFCDPAIPCADPPEPGGPSWLGACYVIAPDAMSAVTVSHVASCNPGGNVLIAGPFALDTVRAAWIAEWVGRLLGKAEARDCPSPYDPA